MNATPDRYEPKATNPGSCWEELERLDERLLALLDRRAELASELRSRLKPGQERAEMRVVSAELRKQWLHRRESMYRPDQLASIYREIQESCLAHFLPERPRVACLGPEASFTHVAACRYFGDTADYDLVRSVEDAVQRVVAGRSDQAVVAITNSVSGLVGGNIDLLADHTGFRDPDQAPSALRICDAWTIHVGHCLLGKGPIDRIRAIHTHAQASAQCRQQIESLKQKYELHDLEIVHEASTSMAASKAALDPSVAVIGNRLAAGVYQLSTLQEPMEDDPDNTTRFLLIGRHAANPRPEQSLTMIWLRVPDRPGALIEALQPLAQDNLNMSLLVSRPVRSEAWQSSFFVEFEGHYEDPQVAEAIRRIRQSSHRGHFLILGSYENALLPSVP